MIKKHSDKKWASGFLRYCLVKDIIESDNWNDLELKLKKLHKDDYSEKMNKLYNEFKFYNCVIGIEYQITDSLNAYFIKNSKIGDWKKLKKKFIEKIKRNNKIKTMEEAEIILNNEIENKKERMLTPSMMLYISGFGLGELIDYIKGYTKGFNKKENLVKKLTDFNNCRKIIVHNPCGSREDANNLINKGIFLYEELNTLIKNIVGHENN